MKNIKFLSRVKIPVSFFLVNAANRKLREAHYQEVVMTYYKVQCWDSMDWIITADPAGRTSNTLMVLVAGTGTLPTSKKDLVMLHRRHANNSIPMIWDEAAGVFTCKHCKTNINLSDSSFQKIIDALSARKFGLLELDNTCAVYIAHRVDKFPLSGVMGAYYAVECEEKDS